MPDDKTAAKARRASAVDRMAALAAAPDPEVTAERSERSKRAAAERRKQTPATTARTVRAAAPMAAETAKPGKRWPERISHATSAEQLDALEEVAKATYRARPDKGKVSTTALLRAAAAICLDDARLRERMGRLAQIDWA
jgi:hypothetical protein